MTPTDLLLEGLLADVTAAGKTLDPAGVFAGLYEDGPDPSPPVTAADFTLPDATDFPAVAVTAWTDPFQLTDGRWAIQSNLLTWRPPDDTNAFSAVGWYLADAATAGNILGWEPISPAVPLPDETREVSLVVRVTFDPQGNWSASVVING